MQKIPQYLVVEDRFPNGRPPLEKAGVFMTDRDTVNNVERDEGHDLPESPAHGAGRLRLPSGL